MSNGFFNFNFLALLLSKISGRHSGGKILTCAQVLGYIYIIVNFRLRSSIHVGLTVRSLYNSFALKNLPKWGFWGILGEGTKIFGWNPPRNATTADLRRLLKKYVDTINTLVCTRGKAITKKKRNVYAVSVIFTAVQCLTPYTPSYPVVHVGSYGRRNHSCTISAQPVQGLESYGNPKFPIYYT